MKQEEIAVKEVVRMALEHHRAGRLLDAERMYRQVLQVEPGNVDALHLLGAVAQQLGMHAQAVSLFERALARAPEFAEAHNNLGLALQKQGRLDEALARYGRALAINPGYVEAHYNQGAALHEAGLLENALRSYREALRLQPDWADARWALTISQLPAVYRSVEEPARCRAAFELALAELEQWCSAQARNAFTAVGSQQPFYLAYQEESNRALLSRYGRLCAGLMQQWLDGQRFSVPAAARAGRVRVGIVSRQFHSQSVWHALLKGWLQHFDRARFELHGFYLGGVHDEETEFARKHSESFSELRGGLQDWVQTILGKRLDVLIYPEIGMDGTTLRLASMRLVPIQIAAWGHPETTGLPTIDYYLSAEDFEPADAQDHYTERLVALPHLGCCYPAGSVGATGPDLGALGIDATVPVLVCPGVPYKYGPAQDWVFPAIARALGRCQFVFFTYRNRHLFDALHDRLKSSFRQAGVRYEDFVVPVPWMNRAAFSGLLQHAHVYLDTLGFSGFNTAMQAIECDLPIVTREGRFMRGRLASAILKRVGLSELVATDEAGYVERAVRLARDNAYRHEMSARIRAAKGILLDDVAPVRALEAFLSDAGRRGADATPNTTSSAARLPTRAAP